MRSLALTSSLFALLASPAAAFDIRGSIETGDGVAIERARVEPTGDSAGSAATVSDIRGDFSIDCDLPCLLLISHPRFVEQVVEIVEAPDGAVAVVLDAKHEISERINVTAGGGVATRLLAETVASTEIRVAEKAAAPTSLTELVEGVAGVAENGQPGLFQVFSIRGVSRHRVMTLVSGMQITSERRAGVATSFIDPQLMGSVDVLRGPASTYYGSGALGGVVQVFPRHIDGWSVEGGFQDVANENFLMVGTGGDDWSLAVARRDAEDDEVSDGQLQNTHFTQLSAAIQKTWRRGAVEWNLLVLPSRGDDIGKPNSDFPDSRVTNYPSEEHLLVKLGVVSETGWQGHVYAHPNSLETEVLRPGNRLNTVDNEAFDLGAKLQREWELGADVVVRAGVDYFGRRGVTADEEELRFSSGERTFLTTLDDAEQDELSLFGSLRKAFGETVLQGGGRVTRQEQSNHGQSNLEQSNSDQMSRSDTAWTGFVGVLQPLGKGFELTANLGTGLRFPNLSERFFTGTTGRGGTIGNPDLDSERSLNLDVGVRWYGKRALVSGQVFRLEIDDYIERVEVSDDLLTYVNLLSGTLRGVEIEGFYQLTDAWLLDWSGHHIDGEADDGSTLADVSADRVQVGVRYELERWRARATLQHRFAKDDAGPGELPIPSADLLSASLTYELSSQLSLTLRGRNLLDETYFSSADDKASAAPGRTLGLSFAWRQ